MLALLAACGSTEDAQPETGALPHVTSTSAHASEDERPQTGPAEVLDTAIPRVNRQDVLALQKRALALPMPSPEAAAGFSRRHEVITGGHLAARSMDLCELAYLFDGGAGRYRVTDIVSVSETTEIEGRRAPAAFTYIQLELLEDWSGFAPDHPVLRIRGGALDHERTQSWDLGVERGEVVGLFLSSPLETLNEGYYRSSALGLFRRKDDGGYSNGHLFEREVTSIDELGKLTSDMYRSLPQVIHRPPWRRLAVPRDRCAHDIAPDAHQHAIDFEALRAKASAPEEVQLEAHAE